MSRGRGRDRGEQKVNTPPASLHVFLCFYEKERRKEGKKERRKKGKWCL